MTPRPRRTQAARLSAGARLALCAAIGLLTTGCLEAEMAITINSNDTVTGSYSVVFDKQKVSEHDTSAGNPEGQTLAQIEEGINSSVAAYEAEASEQYDSRIEKINTASEAGARLTFTDVPFEMFDQLTGADSNDPSTNALSIVNIDLLRVGDNQQVIGTIGRNSETPPLGLDETALAQGTVTLTVTFPGIVTSSNGTLENRTVTWQSSLSDSTEVQAQSSTGPTPSTTPAVARTSGGSSIPLLLIVLAVLVGAGLYYYPRYRRKRGAQKTSTPQSSIGSGTGTEHETTGNPQAYPMPTNPMPTNPMPTNPIPPGYPQAGGPPAGRPVAGPSPYARAIPHGQTGEPKLSTHATLPQLIPPQEGDTTPRPRVKPTLGTPSTWLLVTGPGYGEEAGEEGYMGAWWVDELGRVTDHYQPNPNYRPKDT